MTSSSTVSPHSDPATPVRADARGTTATAIDAGWRASLFVGAGGGAASVGSVAGGGADMPGGATGLPTTPPKTSGPVIGPYGEGPGGGPIGPGGGPVGGPG